MSCKGIMKKTFTDRVEVFKSVLETREPRSATNRGFVWQLNAMKTYLCERYAFSWLNAKRRLLSETSVRTQPLDIELVPFRYQQRQEELLSETK